MIIGIDASCVRSGGAIAHIKGIIENFHYHQHKITQIHIWSYRKLLDELPSKSWLVKHNCFSPGKISFFFKLCGRLLY